jgi:large subunit ribosomal protein L13
MKTFSATPHDIEKKWYIVDAKNQTLGRLASQIAYVLRGKHKPIFTPHMDTGDYVIVINADKVVLTGGKDLKKVYHRHTGFFGGIKSQTAQELRENKPTALMEYAIKGMLPHNTLGSKCYGNLKVYAGDEHPHQAQQPAPLPARTVKA